MDVGDGMLGSAPGETSTPTDHPYRPPKVIETDTDYPYGPPVKVIETEHGEVYHCVEIHKQPGLRHLSKEDALETINRALQFIPRSLKQLPMENASKRVSLRLKDCPPGTVPILVRTKGGRVNYKNAIPKRCPFRRNGSAHKLKKSTTIDQGEPKHEVGNSESC